MMRAWRRRDSPMRSRRRGGNLARTSLFETTSCSDNRILPFFGGSLGAGQFAFVDGALEKQPRRSLHGSCRQTHAFHRIGDRRRARQELRLLYGHRRRGKPRPGSLIHTLLKKGQELFGRRQLLAEGDGLILF